MFRRAIRCRILDQELSRLNPKATVATKLRRSVRLLRNVKLNPDIDVIAFASFSPLVTVHLTINLVTADLQAVGYRQIEGNQ
jgi:hypothetical protein